MIKFLFKSVFGCLISAIVGLILLCIALIWAGLHFAPKIAETTIDQATGFDSSIGEIDVGIFSSKLDIHDFSVKNPSGYPDDRFFEVRRAMFDLSPETSADKLIVDEIIIDIAHAAYVVNKDGDRNALEFSDKIRSYLEKENEEDSSDENTESAEASEPTPFLIKKFTFRMGEVYWVKPDGKVRTFDANIDKTFENVEDVNDIIGPIRDDLTARGMGFLVTGLLADTLQGLGRGVTGSIQGLSELGGEIGGRAAELGGDALEKGGEVVGEGAKKAGQALKGMFNKSKDE